ncbi:pyruvate/2-oxoglutarate dehydrogenase complex, dihydrolipoamide acyltransferase (E2) component [Longilinea arvoryzae]|uniref:Pyruvate/2-oxoglutarate dehydrogenase complex, dihydrolipoamide acyltransferase (E2) component n=1 Tax=Longilinea arvoryzae TaxID=360412 RepID=A0A0S7BCT7_9CHLR|nr:2-oxo acid dehydrogenase subunit E2 [Longilinea arvoryzae]GAP12500.1 pyruvate/2-oxoglutarate dehydrogenase complex, dihydrolipoamide acyltransferase (E2) component [Longilinea arvoryzae]
MTGKHFHEILYPSSRQLTFDMGKIGLGKHHVKALLEVDVTDAWTAVRESRRTSRKISFTAWLLKVIADCAAHHPPVAGLNQAARGRVVVFDDIDLSIVVEKEVNGALVPLPYVIRKADQKTIFQIQDEIEAAKGQPIQGEKNYVLGDEGGPTYLKWFTRLPQWLRLILFRIYLSDPQRVKNAMGTIMVTTVGMLGHTRGWIMPTSIHPLCLAFGSLNEQPAVRGGEIQKRSILHLTVLIDHDVTDGMPAARFVDDLVRKMESGFGL